MRSKQVRDTLRRHSQRTEDRHRGVGESIMRMGSQRTAETQIANYSHLPVAQNSSPLQDAAGNFLFLPGYSDPLGTDV